MRVIKRLKAIDFRRKYWEVEECELGKVDNQKHNWR